MASESQESRSSAGGGGGGRGQTLIPMARVKTIMKSSPEITNINPDTLFLVCKATVNTRIKFHSFNINIKLIFKK
jgi:hypothetical protein